MARSQKEERKAQINIEAQLFNMLNKWTFKTMCVLKSTLYIKWMNKKAGQFSLNMLLFNLVDTIVLFLFFAYFLAFFSSSSKFDNSLWLLLQMRDAKTTTHCLFLETNQLTDRLTENIPFTHIFHIRSI